MAEVRKRIYWTNGDGNFVAFEDIKMVLTNRHYETKNIEGWAVVFGNDSYYLYAPENKNFMNCYLKWLAENHTVIG